MRYRTALPAAAGLVLAIASAPAARAQAISEVEPNNTMTLANLIPSSAYPAGAFAFAGSITPGDVDWLRFTLTQPAVIDAASFGLPNSLIGDSQILLVASNQTTILGFDDDSGIGLYSAMEVTVPAGTYCLGITGFDDIGLGSPGGPHLPSGQHSESFQYNLTVGIATVPSPGAAAALGLGGGAVLLRRRRR